MITLDTSAMFAVLNKRDQDHGRISAAVRAERGPLLLPSAAFAEICYLIEQRLSITVLDAFLADIEDGTLSLDCGDSDIPRIRALVDRYSDLPLGAVDAAVIACAERNGGRVMTLDMRHFGIVAQEGTIVLAPGYGR